MVKCTDGVVVKWESDDQARAIPPVLSLKKNQSDLEEVRCPELEVFRHPNNATYTPLKIDQNFLHKSIGCDLYSGKYGKYRLIDQ